MENNALNDLIATIYNTADRPEKWTEVCDMLQKSLPLETTSIMFGDHRTNSFSFFGTSDVDKTDIDMYTE